MRFSQLDKVTEFIPGERIKGIRKLRAEEDFLRDHFPFFPVMPGVLMLEALFQASLWLVRATDDFENCLWMLKEVRNAKFANFVQPGEILEIDSEMIKRDGNQVSCKATGSKEGVVAVSARLTLELRLDEGTKILGPEGLGFSRHSIKEQWESLATGLAE